MGNLNMLISFSLFFFFISFASSSSINATHKCSPQHALNLLLFKENLSSINDTDNDTDNDSYCQDWLGSGYHPIMMNWNKSTDCCKWDGVTCSHFTGDVIAIDLSCGMLRGIIHPNTTLFHLPHLQTLNLAFNNFSASQLPRDFTHTLTHLNISYCGFGGKVPSEISFLHNLVSLDLSWNPRLQIQPHIMKDLLQNSTHLRELLISHVQTGWVLPTYLNISSSLKLLDLRSTGLQGKFPDNMFSLRYLEKLDLSGENNDITGPLPKVNTSSNIPLKWLDLSSTNLSGEIPDSIAHLKSLTYLDLSSCGLVGPLPKSLVNLRHLSTLYLYNNKLNATLPSFLFTLPFLEDIVLDGNMLSGGLPREFFSCRSLKRLLLWGNQLDGEINGGSTPPSKIQLANLMGLDLSYNNFTGSWELNTLLSSLPNLLVLDLSYSGLTVVINNRTGYVNPDFRSLALASCKLNMFPESLRAMKKLQLLDLSSNNIQGRIPDWVGEIGGNQLSILDLSNNSITGPLPSSICNMSQLGALDLSNNSFDGVIPQCLGNISSSLRMVDMGNNHFHGTIPNVYGDCGRLQGLILKGNQLQGEVPSSLSRCRSLKVLDLGDNQLNGTFPGWLGNLPRLQVLVLKSNKFHGPIETHSTKRSTFPSMRVLDLSHNGFVGHLPGKYIQSFNAMKNIEKRSTKLQYLDVGYKYYSVVVAVKGLEQEFPKILADYIIVDLSSNRFDGEIPGVIGGLTSLIVLNLSHNSLTGHIPSVLGNLSEIESLDLSWNQLTGEIPQSLADLTFLGFLNLSQNHLVGRIPSGTQFSTFETSFGGNPELCGLPLPKKCEYPLEPQLEVNGDEDEESGCTWRVVMMGYGCGTILGLVMGYVMLSTGRPKWFSAIADAAEHMIRTRKYRRRYVFIGK